MPTRCRDIAPLRARLSSIKDAASPYGMIICGMSEAKTGTNSRPGNSWPTFGTRTGNLSSEIRSLAKPSGGCSTMGTLSGGGSIVISVGEGCLIGANAGIGIPLGDRNTVESGLYITAGTKVALLDADNQLVKVVKARELAGQTDLLFRRNSQTGAVECKTHKSAIELNEALHAHN